MDRKTRKLMTLHNHALHPQADVADRLYFKRSEGGRGLMSVEHSNSLSRYVESCKGPLLEAMYKEKILRCYAKTCEAALLQQERKIRVLQEKQLHA